MPYVFVTLPNTLVDSSTFNQREFCQLLAREVADIMSTSLVLSPRDVWVFPGIYDARAGYLPNRLIPIRIEGLDSPQRMFNIADRLQELGRRLHGANREIQHYTISLRYLPDRPEHFVVCQHGTQ